MIEIFVCGKFNYVGFTILKLVSNFDNLCVKILTEGQLIEFFLFFLPVFHLFFDCVIDFDFFIAEMSN